MITRLSLLLAIVLIGFGDLLGQERFDRLYRLDDTVALIGVRVQPTDGGGYYIMSTGSTDSDTAVSLNLTQLDPKGNVNRSFDYDMPAGYSLIPTGDLAIAADGSIYFATQPVDAGLVRNKIVGQIGSSGDVIWSKALGGANVDTTVAGGVFMELTPERNMGVFSTSSTANTASTDVYAAMLGNDGTVKWSNVLDLNIQDTDIPITVTESLYNLDSNFVFTGLVDTIGSRAYLSAIDTSGVVQWSYTYAPDDGVSFLLPLDIDQLADTSYVMTGIYSDPLFGVEGFIARIGRDGTPIWGRRMQLSPFFFSYALDATVVSSGNIVLAGGAVVDNSLLPLSLSYLMEFDPDGNVVWQNLLSAPTRFLNLDLLPASDLVSTADGGSAFYSNFLNLAAFELFPELAKFDPMGSTSCQDTLGFEFVAPFGLVRDTVAFTSTAVTNEEDLTVTQDLFPGFDIPVLTLPDTSYCPDDPIDFLLDATIDGAVSYDWSTGDTTAMITVTEEGEYIVDVRVVDEFCFNLCDTSTVAVYGEPMVSIEVNGGSLCDDGSLLLIASVISEAPSQSLQWSTNEMTNSIRITEPGDYSVVYTDICDQQADASVSISEDDFYQPAMVTLTLDASNCTGGGQLISATTSGDVVSLQWSTGDVGVTGVFAPPSALPYSVIATDICGATDEASITVPTGTFETTIGEDCVADTIRLSFTPSTNIIDGDWTLPDGSTVSIAQQVQALETGVYSLAITDVCGLIGEATTEVTTSEQFLCAGGFCVPDEPSSGCLCFPRVHIPNSQVEGNETFAPINRCGNVENYRLTIYNRWGQKIFETTDPSIDGGWDGEHNGSLAPSGVYIYQATYRANETDFLTHGDVTLIR